MGMYMQRVEEAGLAGYVPTGLSHHSTHLAAHSSAVTFADVVTLHMYAAELQFKLSAGIAS